jgi:hypothetical protein
MLRWTAPTTATSHATNIRITNCNGHHHRRGHAIIGCGVASSTWHQIVFEDCTFADSGDDGTLDGNLTTAGMDVEPVGGRTVRGITYRRCQFLRNGPADSRISAHLN